MRVLLVEDYPLLRTNVTECLIEEGFAVDSSGCGEEGLWYALNHDYDVILLDIMLPKLGGLEILKKIRSREIPTPVILISARDTIEQRIEGLESGADDYLIKPFALEELIARVKVQIRRKHGSTSLILRAGDLEINTTLKTVQCLTSTSGMSMILCVSSAPETELSFSHGSPLNLTASFKQFALSKNTWSR